MSFRGEGGRPTVLGTTRLAPGASCLVRPTRYEQKSGCPPVADPELDCVSTVRSDDGVVVGRMREGVCREMGSTDGTDSLRGLLCPPNRQLRRNVSGCTTERPHPSQRLYSDPRLSLPDALVKRCCLFSQPAMSKGRRHGSSPSPLLLRSSMTSYAENSFCPFRSTTMLTIWFL